MKKSHEWQTLRALPKGTVLYTILRHVSRSGMLRVVDIVQPEKGEIYHVRLDEYDRRYDYERQGYIVRGCGFDAGFQVVYELGKIVHDDGYWFKQCGL